MPESRSGLIPSERMEPASIPATKKGRGSIENPEVREDVPGHIIPIIEREFDDFDTESPALPARRDRGAGVHQVPPQAGRLRPAPARRADDPRQAAVGRHHARAARGLRRRHREVRAAEQGAHHDAPEHPAAPRPAARRRRGDPRAVGRRPVLARGLRQHRPQRHRRPVGRRLRRRALRPHAVRRRLRALLRAPPDDADDAAQDQDGVRRRARRRPLADRHPRHRLPRPRARRRARRRGARRRRHVDHAARRADAVRVRRPRRRRVPQGRRGRASGSSTARTSCASTAPAPASRCSSTRSASTRFREMVDEELAGRLGRRARLRRRRPALRRRRGGARAGRARRRTRRPNGDLLGVRALPRRQRPGPAPGRLLARSTCKVTRGDLTPEQLRGIADIMRRYCGGFMRTTVHQNFVLRWVRDETVYEVWQALDDARPRRGRPGQDHRRRLVPGHRLVQARHHVARWA